MLYIHS